MRTLRNRKGTKFFVDFGPVAIEDTLGKELEGKIQQLALGVLAKTDYNGDISLGGSLPPDLYGLTVGDDDGDNGESTDAIRGISRARIGARRKSITIPGKLASSKAAGAKAIRVSRVRHDIHFEHLDKHNQPMTGFVLHPVINKRNKLTAVTITRIGSTSTGETVLGAADRAALASIVDELSQFMQAGAAGGGTATPFSWWGVIGTGISCGLAAVEGGANLYEDGACAAGIIDVLAEDDDDDDDDDDD